MSITEVFLYILGKLKENMSIFSEIATIVTPFLITGITIWYTNCRNIKNDADLREKLELEKSRWINDAYLKRESEVLLEFRDAYFLSQDSIFWFFHRLLSPMKFGNFTPTEEQRTIKYEELLSHFKNLKTLNDLYNKNQLIFRKHNFEEDIVLITILLDVLLAVSSESGGKDLGSYFVRKTESLEEYHLHLYKYSCCMFTMLMQTLEYKIEVGKSLDDYFVDTEEYKKTASTRLNSLMIRIDEKTVYYDGKLPNNMKNRQMKFYSDSYVGKFLAKDN